MNDPYAFWRAALAGNYGPIPMGQPQCGFYRRKITPGAYGIWTPVAIWQDESGAIQALQHKRIESGRFIVAAPDAWDACCIHPITEDAYRAVAERNEPWPAGVGATDLRRKAAKEAA